MPLQDYKQMINFRKSPFKNKICKKKLHFLCIYNHFKMVCTFLYLHQSTNIQYSEYFHSLVSFKLINNVHNHV